MYNDTQQQHNEFSIRAKMCQSLKDILVDKDNQWQPLVDKKCKAIDGQATLVVVAVFVLLLGVIITLKSSNAR
jgi:hypothetical protein